MQAKSGSEKLRALIKDIGFAMLTTVERDGSLRSRPMAVLDQERDGQLLFFTAVDSAKVSEVERHHEVNVAFAEPQENRFVSVSGTAVVERDRAIIQRLWKPAYRAWFPKGVEDPNIGVLRVDIDYAEYWDSPSSKMVQLAGLVKSLATGQRASPGETAKVTMNRPPYPDTGDYEPPAHFKDEEHEGERPDIIAPIDEQPD